MVTIPGILLCLCLKPQMLMVSFNNIFPLIGLNYYPSYTGALLNCNTHEAKYKVPFQKLRYHNFCCN